VPVCAGVWFICKAHGRLHIEICGLPCNTPDGLKIKQDGTIIFLPRFKVGEIIMLVRRRITSDQKILSMLISRICLSMLGFWHPSLPHRNTIGLKIINLAKLEGGSCIVRPRRPIIQSKFIILMLINQEFAFWQLLIRQALSVRLLS
jgi:hypothetical protein